MNSILGAPINFTWDNIRQEYIPTLYPDPTSKERMDKWKLPTGISSMVSRLNSGLESKYSFEYLKICTCYNKAFPSLKWGNTGYGSSHNVLNLTAFEQETGDVGTGITRNYLKTIIDQVVSRIGNVSFDVTVNADVPTLMYVVYKEELERVLRAQIRKNKLTRMATEVFHDAAILGYGHILLDPFTEQWMRVADFEIGYFEPEFNTGDIQHLLYRNFAFPVSKLSPYVKGCDPSKLEGKIGNKVYIDLKLYFDAYAKKAYTILGGEVFKEIDYPFERVLIDTFSWDIGVKRVLITSLYNELYPQQRVINQLDAKLTQDLATYKGPTPIMSTDAPIALKRITNSSAECLYVDDPAGLAQMLGTINPTPLDPNLSTESNAAKTTMFELAGVQQLSMDMENYRSAAAIIALDQAHDATFQSQLSGMAVFVQDILTTYITFMASKHPQDGDTGIDWRDVNELTQHAYIEVKPIHINDPLGSKKTPQPDYDAIATKRYIVDVVKGRTTYADLPISIDDKNVRKAAVNTLIRVSSTGEQCEPLIEWLMDAYIDDIIRGEAQL